MPCGVQPTSLERRSNSFLTSRRVAQTSVLSPGSLTHSASTLSLLRYLATSTQASFKHRNSQLALSSSYLTSCCRTHDNNPTCAHSTPARHRAATGAVFTMCVCAWRAGLFFIAYGETTISNGRGDGDPPATVSAFPRRRASEGQSPSSASASSFH